MPLPSSVENPCLMIGCVIAHGIICRPQQAGPIVVCPAGSNRIAGYFVLSMGQILAQEALGSLRRNMPRHIPAVTLGRLAIDRAWQGKGLGRALLSDAVSRSLRASAEVSARLVIVHAPSPAAEAFYLHHGFTRLPVETPTFALDLLKLQKLENIQESFL